MLKAQHHFFRNFLTRVINFHHINFFELFCLINFHQRSVTKIQLIFTEKILNVFPKRLPNAFHFKQPLINLAYAVNHHNVNEQRIDEFENF